MLVGMKLGQLEEKRRFDRIDNKISDLAFNSLIKSCCKSEPAERLTIRQCIDALKVIKKSNA